MLFMLVSYSRKVLIEQRAVAFAAAAAAAAVAAPSSLPPARRMLDVSTANLGKYQSVLAVTAGILCP